MERIWPGPATPFGYVKKEIWIFDNSDILTLPSNRPVIIPAPGVKKVIQVIGGHYRLTTGPNAYDNIDAAASLSLVFEGAFIQPYACGLLANATVVGGVPATVADIDNTFGNNNNDFFIPIIPHTPALGEGLGSLTVDYSLDSFENAAVSLFFDNGSTGDLADGDPGIGLLKVTVFYLVYDI